MKAILKEILDIIIITFMRLFVSPCYGCQYENDCKIFAKRGYCGDFGLCEYVRKDDDETCV